MAELDVSGSFLITIGRGAGPETWVVISVSSEDGKPKLLNFPKKPDGQQPASVFVVLSAMWGAHEIPLRIVEVRQQEPGFYGLRVEPSSNDAAVDRLEAIRPSTLGIVIDDGTDRGQALACSCGAAEVTAWFADRTRTHRRKGKRSSG